MPKAVVNESGVMKSPSMVKLEIHQRSSDLLKNVSLLAELWSLMEVKLVDKVSFIFLELWTSVYFQYPAERSSEPASCSIQSI